MSDFEKAFSKLSKVSLENHTELWGEPKTERAFFEAGQASKQAEIDQLKAKNTQLTHALVNANAEKSKWSKDYWQLVERNAEYGSMLMSDPDSLEFKCYQKEKQNEELVKQLKIQQVILSALKPRLHKTDMGDCLHFSTTMFHEGKAECFDCGAIVNHERKVIGVRRGEHETK